MNSIHEVIFLLVSMGILLCVSAFFSGAETALFSLTSEGARRLRARRQAGHLLSILKEEPEELLTAILFGNLIVNILFFCTGSAAAGQWASSRGGLFDALGGVGVLLSIIMFGEIVPKAVGVAHPRGVLRIAASPLIVWFTATKPFRRGVAWFLRICRLQFFLPVGGGNVTQGELRELLDAVQDEPGFGEPEKEALEDILILTDVRARELMTPRTQVARRACDASAGEILEEARRRASSRVLISGSKEDELLGYVSVGDFLLDDHPVRVSSVLRDLLFVPETARADRLLKIFRSGRREIVAVVDEYGGFSGVIMLEDVVSNLVGTSDQFSEEYIAPVGDNRYRLSGLLPVRAWRDLFVGVLPEKEVVGLAFDTLGGLVVSLLQRIPEPGDQVRIRNLCFSVEGVEQGRITSVLLQLDSLEGGE